MKNGDKLIPVAVLHPTQGFQESSPRSTCPVLGSPLLTTLLPGKTVPRRNADAYQTIEAAFSLGDYVGKVWYLLKPFYCHKKYFQLKKIEAHTAYGQV